MTMALLSLLAIGQPTIAQHAKTTTTKLRTFTIDPTQSQIVATLLQEGWISRRYATHRVEVRSFRGQIQLAPQDETQVALTVEAEMRSLVNVDKGMSDLERREFHSLLQNEVLTTAKFPTSKYTANSIFNVVRAGDERSFALNGELTLRGVTRRVAVPVKVILNAAELRATGEAKFKQSDFELKPFVKGLGLIKIGDEVKVNFTIVAKAL